MSLDIRPLAAADRKAWHPLWIGYQTFYNVALAADVSDVTWRRLLNDDEPMHGAIAWRGREAIGLVHFLTHRSCWTTGDYCYLQDLFVDETSRSGGVGRQLIEHVYGWARTAGCSRVYWLTQHDNADAMKLYDRIADRSGFIQYRKLFVPL